MKRRLACYAAIITCQQQTSRRAYGISATALLPHARRHLSGYHQRLLPLLPILIISQGGAHATLEPWQAFFSPCRGAAADAFHV